MNILLEHLPAAPAPRVEVAERKGLGHPDTLCDAVAEAAGAALHRAYVARFGRPLHYNVDKALLIGGDAAPAFGGGEVRRPFEIVLAGRATRSWQGVDLPVEAIAEQAARAWLRDHLHAVDVDRHLRLACRFGPGSGDLCALFERARANDSSVGVGYAPLGAAERAALAVEAALRGAGRPALGEDTKVLAVRVDGRLELTVAVAMIGAHLPSLAAYVEERDRVAALARAAAAPFAEGPVRVSVNAADDLPAGDVYLTVTGTSAEAGDDGEVGRGNRVNGVITPLRPMSLEAAAGKNVSSHVGRLYNTVAGLVAAELAAELPGVGEVACCLASRIGDPVDEPALVHVRVRGGPSPGEARVAEVVRAQLAALDTVRERLLSGTLGAY